MYEDDRRYGDRGYRDDRRYPPPPPPDDQGRGGRGGRGERGPTMTEPLPPGGSKGATKVSYKCLAGMVVAIVALILIYMFMSYPWYSVNYTANNRPTNSELKYTMEYNIDEISYEFKAGDLTFKNTTKYDDERLGDTVDEVKVVMDNVYLLHLIVLILLIISIILIPIAAIGKIPHAVGMVFLILAIIFILIIPIYFFLYLPPAVEQQFSQIGDMTEPMNETFIYNGEFLSSGRGTWYDEDNNEWRYTQEWGPGIAFWLIFMNLIIIVVAQVVYAAGKADIMRSKPDYYRSPPGPAPPYNRDRGRPVRDYGPPRPMGRDDYDYPPPERRPPRDDYGYHEPPPPGRSGGHDDYGGYDYPPAPRGRGGPDYGSRPPPRPPRRRDGY